MRLLFLSLALATACTSNVCAQLDPSDCPSVGHCHLSEYTKYSDTMWTCADAEAEATSDGSFCSGLTEDQCGRRTDCTSLYKLTFCEGNPQCPPTNTYEYSGCQ